MQIVPSCLVHQSLLSRPTRDRMCFLNLTQNASDQAKVTWTQPVTQSITSSHYHQTATSSSAPVRQIVIDRSRSPLPLEGRCLRREISRVSPGDRNYIPRHLLVPSVVPWWW